MIISERHKGKSTCDIKCDKCGKEWRGHYYVMKKRDNHYCPSCAFKKGWKDKFDKNPYSIPEELKPFIIKRVDGKSLNHLPKRKGIKIIIKCSKCGYERQSNAHDVLVKNSTLCNSCIQKELWNNESFKNKQLKIRRTKEYRKKMSESIKNSQAWKDTQYLRNE